MAGFKTHITVSCSLGVVYGAAAGLLYDVPVPACVLAGGLCGVSGMLPDLDSDSGTPLRESVGFAAAVAPMLMLPRFSALGFDAETIVLAGAGVYLLIRFGLAKLLKKYTVHRGMFHSFPAALIAAEVAFLLCAHEDLWRRYFFAGGVLTGFMSHLVLDEIWSMEFHFGYVRFKKSFGTAMKFWSDSMWGNLSAYIKVAVLSFLVYQDPVWSYGTAPADRNVNYLANRIWSRLTHLTGQGGDGAEYDAQDQADQLDQRPMRTARAGQSSARYQDTRYQDNRYLDSRYQNEQDTRFQDSRAADQAAASADAQDTRYRTNNADDGNQDGRYPNGGWRNNGADDNRYRAEPAPAPAPRRRTVPPAQYPRAEY